MKTAISKKWLIVIGTAIGLLIVFMLPLRLHIPYPAAEGMKK
jgi:hypothetical protein